jgi:cytidylate kinase
MRNTLSRGGERKRVPIIAITREMGSLGKDVAKGLSEACGVPLVYHEVIDHLADRMRVRKSHVERLLDGRAGLVERLTADKTSLSVYSADEVVNLAAQGRGAVIRGWGGTHLLRGVPHAVCVRVCAPFGLRRERMMQRLGTDDRDRVGEEIRRNDEAHGAIMRRNFSLQWSDSEHYDMVFNTERLSVEECIDKVGELVRSAAFTETDESRRRLEDLALAWRVRAALRLAERTRELRIAVSAEQGRVTLEGMVHSAEQRAAASEVAAAVDGVRELDERLRAIESLRPRFN